MAVCVPTVKTNFTIADFVKSLVIVWQQMYGELPQKKQLAVIYAQWSIETGQGKSCWNNNIGNVKYIPSKNKSDSDIQYMMLKNVWEIINGKKVIFQPPHQATWFRSFPTLIDGVTFHLDFLKNKRYKKAWSAIEAGNPGNFAHLLKVANYYTAPEADYVRAVTLYFNKFMKDDVFEKVIESITPPALTTAVEHIETPVIEKITTDPSTVTELPIITPAPIAEPEPIPVAAPVSNSFLKSIIQLLFNLFTKK